METHDWMVAEMEKALEDEDWKRTRDCSVDNEIKAPEERKTHSNFRRHWIPTISKTEAADRVGTYVGPHIRGWG